MPSITLDRGNLRIGAKSDLFSCFEGLSDAKSQAPPATSVILDGAAIAQMLKPAAAMNFEKYARDVFISFISTKLQTATRCVGQLYC